MSFKKLLVVTSVIIFSMFGLMLATSYAWYSYEGGSTTFDGVTKADDLLISYQNGEYINTSIAVPVSEEQIDMYSEKNNFNIKVTGNDKKEEIKVSVKLIDVEIADELKDADFKIEMYYQGFQRASFSGTQITAGTDINFGSVMLDNDISNQFEIRVYILDDGTDQNVMMNRIFKGKIEVEVISRLRPVMNNYDEGADIYVSSITIDGESSDSLPTEGTYSMTSNCDYLEWDTISKTITYTSGSKVGEDCTLTFTTDDDYEYPLLSEMPVGSYVKYSGSNGCEGKKCQGENANYVSDTDMGYCNDSRYKFFVNGWRIAYKENGSAYLVSAGALECVVTYVDGKSSTTSSATLSSSRKYGSGYEFNSNTGKFTLTGIVTKIWGSSTYQDILDNTPYTCSDGKGSCNTLYELDARYNDTTAYYYTHNNYETTNGLPLHLGNLDKQALKYCNPKYAKDGVCDITTAWSMNLEDFNIIVNGVSNTNTSCYNNYRNISCGYTNDLIDNGSYYWLTYPYGSNFFVLVWYPTGHHMTSNLSNVKRGLRPVLHLDSNVVVTGGSGTYNDPYTIDIG